MADHQARSQVELLDQVDQVAGHRRRRVLGGPVAAAVPALVDADHVMGPLRHPRHGVPLPDVAHDGVQHDRGRFGRITALPVVQAASVDEPSAPRRSGIDRAVTAATERLDTEARREADRLAVATTTLHDTADLALAAVAGLLEA